MDFALSAEQQAIKEMARKFAEREIRPLINDCEREARYPVALVREMGRLGLMGGVVPPEYGGAGMSYAQVATLVMELSRVWQLAGAAASYSSGLMGAGLLRYGSPEQKQKYLAPVCRGERIGTTAVTEPQSGSDVAAMQTRAVRDGQHYVITGAKTWISLLEGSDWFLTFAQLDPEKRHKGICAFIIERDTPGLTVRPFKETLGFRSFSSGDVILDEVRVPRANLVGAEGDGFRVAMSAVEAGRMGVAARATGVIEACLEESVRYAKERVVFGQPIGRYQLTQSKITDMVVALETARSMVYQLAWLKDQGDPRARVFASVAKMHATDLLMKVATDAAQIFGAYCNADEFPVNRFFRDAKVLQIVEGTNELHRVIIGEHALGYRWA